MARWWPEPTPRCRCSDHGFTVGDGVFETLKVVDGTPFAMQRHLDRLRLSAVALGLDAPADSIVRSACDELVTAWVTGGGGDARLRITVTSGVGPPGSGSQCAPNRRWC